MVMFNTIINTFTLIFLNTYQELRNLLSFKLVVDYLFHAIEVIKIGALNNYGHTII